MVETSVFLAFAGFALVGTLSPGPNNIMVMASGANFGLRRTLPHIFGIATGFAVMATLAGVGLMVVFDAVPVLFTVLKVVSVTYLLYLALKIARAAPPDAGTEAEAKPITFLQAAAFQWVNPKGWAFGMTAMTLYAPEHTLVSVLRVALLFCVFGLPANVLWTLMGTILRRWLSNQRRLRIFNFTMAALLVASLYPALML
ncbi:LysE family translocator [Acuticoccus sp. MNP-M23]|uniref:LysE family translocator n=1 Tax=Acuticoccus sp. MNP-M23 TaxID=3072793 RepID=UPI00281650CF|nr:LysE family translocator [Acuticoccus sp. MNP-M23]WMS41485.1 LysE family translocator [Acuticoccus sp. MNP-M23]